MYGYAGKIGFIDLSRNRVSIEETGEELIKGYLGGIGFFTRLLYDYVPRGADPYGPENAVIFAVGPVNGTLTPSSSRWNVGAKSPATGLIVSGNAGGIWGSELKWAGFDALVIKGRAERPSYLLVEDGKIEICPADELWGKDTWETEALLQAKYRDPNLRVAGIEESSRHILKKLFGLCREAMHINFLAYDTPQRSVELFYVKPEVIRQFAVAELAPAVTLRHDKEDIFLSVYR